MTERPLSSQPFSGNKSARLLSMTGEPVTLASLTSRGLCRSVQGGSAPLGGTFWWSWTFVEFIGDNLVWIAVVYCRR